MYCLWVSVLGMINLFFEDTGILLRKRSLMEADCPSDEADLTA
jgi:hypothetical protein